MKTNQKILAIIIVAILATVMLMPQILNATAKNSSITILVNYKDGSFSTHNSQSIIAQSILSGGKEISNIVVSVYMSPSYSGTISTYTVTGDFSKTLGTYSSSSSIVPVSPLPILTSDASTLIFTTTITEAQISSFINNWQVGTNYNLIFTASNFAIQGKFTDNTNFGPIVAATQQAQITLTYSSGNSFNGISISFSSGSNPTPTQIPPTTTFTFGNTQKGTLVDWNDANAQSISYFTSQSTGQITNINAYIASTDSVKVALYSQSGTLLAQSNGQVVGSENWYNFVIPPTYVTSGSTYGLAIMGTQQVTLFETSGGSRIANGGNFVNGFSNPFGATWGTDTTASIDIYALGTLQ